MQYARIAGRRTTDCLETIETSDECPKAWHALYCAGGGSFYPEYQRWGFSGVVADLEERKHIEQRERLIRIAEKYLNDPSCQDVAALVLAFQGVSRSGEHDIFELVSEQSPINWYALAALGDVRTTKLAATEYRRLRSRQFGDIPRNKLMNIIDCLYHLRDKESRAVLKQLADDDEDEALTEYIRKTAGISPAD